MHEHAACWSTYLFPTHSLEFIVHYLRRQCELETCRARTPTAADTDCVLPQAHALTPLLSTPFCPAFSLPFNALPYIPRTALSLLEVFEPALSSASDVLDALDLLQSLAPLTYDSSRLVTRAFGHALEGVTDARLETLRREFRAVGLAKREGRQRFSLGEPISFVGMSTCEGQC